MPWMVPRCLMPVWLTTITRMTRIEADRATTLSILDASALTRAIRVIVFITHGTCGPARTAHPAGYANGASASG